MGVPRLKEIINVSKHLKTPGVEVHLKGDIGFDQDKAQDVIKTLEYTTLRSLTEYTEIVYDPGNVWKIVFFQVLRIFIFIVFTYIRCVTYT